MRLLLFLACLLLVSSVSAQHAWEDFVEEYTSGAIETEEGNLQQHLLDLKELYEHPMNINEAGVDDLMQLPFLSEAQIEQIHAYIYLHGQMQTLAELRLVPLLDEVTRRRLSFFVYAEPQKPEEKVRLFGALRHDFSTRLDVLCITGRLTWWSRAVIVAILFTIVSVMGWAIVGISRPVCVWRKMLASVFTTVMAVMPCCTMWVFFRVLLWETIVWASARDW